MSYKFTNDYSEIAHKEIIKAINKALKEQNIGYGLDKHSNNAKKLILKKFGIKKGDVFFLSSGTQTNMTIISFLLKPYEAVLSCNTGHINVHETGAVEGSGHKVVTCINQDGKITPKNIKEAVFVHNNEHMVKIKIVYISNSTETGTIYTKQELLDIRKVCDELGLYLFLDGARLGVALTSYANDVDTQTIGNVCDVFYVGGTKNGLMFGEAIVFKNKDLAEYFRYHIKNKGAMLAKGFVLGIQFERAFKDNFYFDIAKNANEMALYIKEGLKNVVCFSNDSPTNQLFIELDSAKADDIIEKFGCELWEDKITKKIIRIVTSFATKKEDCDEIINYIKEICK